MRIDIFIILYILHAYKKKKKKIMLQKDLNVNCQIVGKLNWKWIDLHYNDISRFFCQINIKISQK